MQKLTTCKACGKEVAKSAKSCPNCGQKLKMGLMLKGIIGICIIIAAVLFFSLSPKEEAEKLSSELKLIESTSPTNTAASGPLAETFNLGSSHTDVQRQDLTKQIKGQVIVWSLPVYEVKRLDEKINKYRIQTSSKGNSSVGTFITVYARSEAEKQLIENLKTGDQVKIKGRITGTTLRNIDVEPAIIVQ